MRVVYSPRRSMLRCITLAAVLAGLILAPAMSGLLQAEQPRPSGDREAWPYRPGPPCGGEACPWRYGPPRGGDLRVDKADDVQPVRHRRYSTLRRVRCDCPLKMTRPWEPQTAAADRRP